MLRRSLPLSAPVVLLLACSKSPASPGPTAGDASLSPDANVTEDAGACTSPEFTGSPLGVHCNQLVDSTGRTVLLHGLNDASSGCACPEIICFPSVHFE